MILQGFTERHRWIWSLIGVVALWGALALVTSRFNLQSLTGVASSASFLVLVALGQMLVVTTGRGNIDLSVAGTVTVGAFVGVLIAPTGPVAIATSLVAVLAVGLVTGAVNGMLVVLFRIPAIIATLATGYVLATVALLLSRSVSNGLRNPALVELVVGRTLGVPHMLVLAVLFTAALIYVMRFTAFGRQLVAVGQSHRAAHLAGIGVGPVITTAFLASSLLSALDGWLLGIHAGGAFLDMGTRYVLQSVGAVVLGGTLVIGGASTPLGCLFGSLLLVLITTTTQIASLPAGLQDIVQGAIVILVLAVAGGSAVRRSGTRSRARLAPVPTPGQIP